jgi:hypothetical protein
MTPRQLNAFGKKRYGDAWERREGKERFADELSRSPSTIYEWLAGTSNVPATAVRRIKELAQERTKS